MKKRMLSSLLVLVMMLSLLPAMTTTVLAYSTGDDYPSEYKNPAADSIVDRWKFYNRECTSFAAWCLNSRNGVNFTNQYLGAGRWGNATSWGDVARDRGVTVDMNPAVGAIAWWRANEHGAYGTGHVAWVSAVDGNTVTIEEYNAWPNLYAFQRRTISKSAVSGYIHIKDIASLQPTVTFSPWSNDEYTYILETDAAIGQEINVSGGTCTETGMYLYDANGKQLASAKNDFHTLAKVYFPINAECHYTLTPGTTYKYKFYAIVNGKTYWSGEGSFKTSPAPQPSYPSEAQNIGSGFYACISYPKGNLNLENGSNNVQTAIKNSGDPRQIWQFNRLSDGTYNIVNMYDGLYLDVQDGGSSGANIQTWPDNGYPAQKWKIVQDAYGTPGAYNLLASYDNSLALDINNAETSPGTNVQAWMRNATAAQAFQIKQLSDKELAKVMSTSIGSDFYAQICYLDTYVQTTGIVEDAGSGHKYMDVQITRKANPNDPRQIWHFKQRTDGSYKIINEASGWCLDVPNGDACDRQNVWTWFDDNDSNAQSWYLLAVPGASTFRFASPIDFSSTSFNLDVSEGSSAEGTNIQLYHQWDTGAQKFTIAKVNYTPKPDTPVVSPITPEVPATPETPTTPNTPDNPEVPDTPTTPGTPENPAIPDIPDYDPLPPAISFSDVASNSYFYDAVVWAVSAGVTSGTGPSTFSPDLTCTRAQMVTFLWRAAGSPTVSGSNPFTDISEEAYYYHAVMWAVEKGITAGSGNTRFSPNSTVTRGQTVTFLYRYAGAPASGSGSSFVDVAPGAYYASAVNWAVNKGITNGTSPNRFSPNDTCTRAQSVTFLYRACK